MLEVIAMFSMVIDHIGFVFFPELIFFREIGRIAFPLYAFGIVQGYYRTTNIKRYFLRLMTLAIISQLPYSLLFSIYRPNVIFTLFLGLTLIYFFDNYRHLIVFLLPVVVMLENIIHFEYGVYGIILIFTYWYISSVHRVQKIYLLPRAEKVQVIIIHLLLNFAFNNYPIQHLSLISTIGLLYLTPLHQVRIRINRYLFRAFYPVHLTLLLLLK